MNTIITRAFTILAVLTAPIFAFAQSENTVAEDPAGEAREVPILTAEQLDELLGPIALYPDALVALILPASTMPTDLVLASRYIGAGGDKTKVDEQPWDESVRALAHYPDVVTWLDDKLSWAIMMGDAFIAQPVDVMQSIQRLRARARAAGTLVDSAEQKVVEEEGSIRIVPAQPEVIYVPVYDPRVVYVERPYWGWGTSVITYRWCYPTGIWLSYDCDWSHHRVWVVNTHWRHRWYHDHGWRRSYHDRRHHYYDDRGFGGAWMPRRHDNHRDFRRDGRHRDSRVIVRDGHRDFRDERRRDRVDSRRDDGRRHDGRINRGGGNDGRSRSDHLDNVVRVGPNNRVSVERRDTDTRRDRRESSDRSQVDRTTRSDRRPERTTGTVAVIPERARVSPPSAPAPRVAIPPADRKPEARQSESNRRPGNSGRWLDRATHSGWGTRARIETPATNSAPTAPRLAPRADSAPRIAPERAARAERRSATQTARVPLPGGGSRSVTVGPSAGERGKSSASVQSGERGSRSGRGSGDSGGRTERGKRGDR